MDGQITITDFLKSKLELRQVMSLTQWINAHGKSQYEQVADVIREKLTDYDEENTERLINAVSVYVLEQSLGYMEYLQEESKL